MLNFPTVKSMSTSSPLTFFVSQTFSQSTISANSISRRKRVPPSASSAISSQESPGPQTQLSLPQDRLMPLDRKLVPRSAPIKATHLSARNSAHHSTQISPKTYSVASNLPSSVSPIPASQVRQAQSCIHENTKQASKRSVKNSKSQVVLTRRGCINVQHLDLDLMSNTPTSKVRVLL